MKTLNNKYTGQSWAKRLGIKFKNYEGFGSIDFFTKVMIEAEDFASRAAQCEVEKPEITTRRDANKLKKTLNYNLQ